METPFWGIGIGCPRIINVSATGMDAYRGAKDNSDRLVASLRDNLAVLQQNQEDIQEIIKNPDGIPEYEKAEDVAEDSDETAPEEDFDFPEGTFLNDEC